MTEVGLLNCCCCYYVAQPCNCEEDDPPPTAPVILCEEIENDPDGASGIIWLEVIEGDPDVCFCWEISTASPQIEAPDPGQHRVIGIGDIGTRYDTCQDCCDVCWQQVQICTSPGCPTGVENPWVLCFPPTATTVFRATNGICYIATPSDPRVCELPSPVVVPEEIFLDCATCCGGPCPCPIDATVTITNIQADPNNFTGVLGPCETADPLIITMDTPCTNEYGSNPKQQCIGVAINGCRTLVEACNVIDAGTEYVAELLFRPSTVLPAPNDCADPSCPGACPANVFNEARAVWRSVGKPTCPQAVTVWNYDPAQSYNVIGTPSFAIA